KPQSAQRERMECKVAPGSKGSRYWPEITRDGDARILCTPLCALCDLCDLWLDSGSQPAFCRCSIWKPQSSSIFASVKRSLVCASPEHAPMRWPGEGRAWKTSHFPALPVDPVFTPMAPLYSLCCPCSSSFVLVQL